MRILHLSDIHCDSDGLSRVLSQERYDLAVISGDFVCLDTLDAMEGYKERTLAVTGNMDDISIRRRLLSIGLLIDGRVREFSGLRFGGIGGIDPRADIMALKADLGKIERLDVLVSHHPPHGVLDRTFLGVRIGLRDLRDLLVMVRPRLHLFGHVHESPGQQVYEGIMAVNPGPLFQGRYALIELAKEEVRVELKRL
ncbi:MAG: metallophosphoesterase family protein [Acidilobus sp.]